MSLLLSAAGLAFALSAVSMPAMIRSLVRFDLQDTPNSRSSHSRPTPRGAGIGVMVAASTSLTILGLSAAIPRQVLLVWLVSVGFSLVGLVDDWRSQPPSLRLATQLLLALLFAIESAPQIFGLPPILSIAITTLWLTAFVNAFNFMDGINGISALTATAIGSALSANLARNGTASLALAASAISGAVLGFLPFNFPKARVFLGDAGSYGIGAAIGASAVVSLDFGVPPAATLLPFALYIADVTFTLFRRIRRGASPFEAHREHTYQTLSTSRWSPTKTAVLVAALVSLAALTGSVAWNGLLPQLGAVGFVILICWSYLRLGLYEATSIENLQTRRSSC